MKIILFAGRVLALAVWIGCLPALAQGLRQPIEPGARVTIECLTGNVDVAGESDNALTVATDGNPSAIKFKRLDDGTYRVFAEPPMMPHRLRVSVPRQAITVGVKTRSAGVSVRDVETANVATVSGDVVVERVSGGVSVSTTSGRIKLSEVGAAQVRTVSSDVAAKLARGGLTVNAISGNLVAADIDGDVMVQMISGNADIRCARGRVNVSTVSGDIKLAKLENEIAVETTSGNVTFTGALTPVKRCAINAFSGDIKMAVPETCGFEAKFKSFSGTLKSDFPLERTNPPLPPKPVPPPPPPVSVGVPPRPLQGSTIVWRHGDGAAKVFLTTFSGKVMVVRNPATDDAPCAPLPQ
ncbi:MAG: hypothetical protein CFK52_01995 [Chloracidobacterium sp. CP2_5A]|nr:MAG: hypothetical protein CFK52_01995 [Chloracidobacterium sp. CP2_5A]